MNDFDVVFDRVIGNEAGFQKHPGDRGNWTSGIVGKGELKGTKWGLAAMTYPNLDIPNLTKDQAKGIYYRDWWQELGFDKWGLAIAYQLFDAAINHGMANASKMLQRAVGVKDDGKIGPLTIAAIKAKDESDVLMLFLAERLDFMNDLGTWPTFGRGWAQRICENLRYGAEDTK